MILFAIYSCVLAACTWELKVKKNLQAFQADYKIRDTWHTQYSCELYIDMKQDFSANFCY